MEWIVAKSRFENCFNSGIFPAKKREKLRIFLDQNVFVLQRLLKMSEH